MKVEVTAGERTIWHYAIKDTRLGCYMNVVWHRDQGDDVCGWFELQQGFSSIGSARARAERRYQALLAELKRRLAELNRLPANRQRAEQAGMISGWLGGDLVLVHARISVSLEEQVV
jgi:hypothetical protein